MGETSAVAGPAPMVTPEAQGTQQRRPESTSKQVRERSERQASLKRQKAAAETPVTPEDRAEGIEHPDVLLNLSQMDYLVIYSPFQYCSPEIVEQMFIAMGVQICAAYPTYIQTTLDGSIHELSQRKAVRVQLPRTCLQNKELRLVIGQSTRFGPDEADNRGGGLMEYSFTVEIDTADKARDLPSIRALIHAEECGKASVMFTHFDMALPLHTRCTPPRD